MSRAITDLDRFKVALESTPEYYHFGHDNSRSTYDKALVSSTEDGASVSLFFAGIGDERHLYGTVMGIAAQEMNTKSQRSFRTVANNIILCAVTRNLVI
jgi:hypothetical protein